MPLPTILIDPVNEGDLLSARFSYSATVVQLIRGIEGARWQAPERRWTFPIRSLPQALKVLAGVPYKLHTSIAKPALELEAWTPPAIDVDVEEAIERAYTFKTKPYEHQKKAMALAIKAERFALLMEMGTGKTKSTIDILSYWLQMGNIGGALIVCPKAMLYTWEREIATHSPLALRERQVVVLTGTGTVKERLLTTYWDKARFFVTNYATLQGLRLPLDKLVHTKRLAIVLDESTNIKTPSSQTAKGALKLGKLSNFKLILNGTPITQGPLDAFSQFKFLEESIVGHHNFVSFKNEYAITGGFQGKEIVGYKNLERLTKRLFPHSFRVLKKDCLDIPDKVYKTIEVAAGSMQRTAYKMMKEDSLIELEGKHVAAPITLVRMLRLQQITSGYLPLFDADNKFVEFKEMENPKLDACEELVEEAVSQGRKVLVWCRFIPELLKAVERLKRFGAEGYHGEVSSEDRQKIVDRFQTDSTCQVFVGQLQTGGLGITLHAATVEIYISNAFKLDDRLQSEDRAHRIGQKHQVDIIDITVKGTIDAYVLKTLKEKKNLADVITGDNLREVMGDA